MRALAAAIALALVSATGCASTRSTCFVLRDLDGPRDLEVGDACGRAYYPASTFKVPHAMIALEIGARSGPDDLEKWNGENYPIPAWNHDHTLASAMPNSVVWYFQRTAVKIRPERMTEWLERLHYGNARIGADVTSFWLEGPLEITPRAQADFMANLARRELPFRPDVMDAVDAMILQEHGTIVRGGTLVPLDVDWDEGTRVHAKTGSTEGPEGNVRWLVGHVTETRAHHRWAFASLVVTRDDPGSTVIFQAMHHLRDAGVVQPR